MKFEVKDMLKMGRWLYGHWGRALAGSFRSKRVLWLGVLWVCVLGCFLGGGTAIAAAQVLSIDAARQQPTGVDVVLEGVVTVPGQGFASAILDQGFALQDDTGGIYIHSPVATDFPIGTAVKLIGTLEEDGHGERWVSLKGWQVSDAPLAAPLPKPVSLQAAGKQTDGLLVKVQGTITRPLVEDAPYGDRFWMGDETKEIQVYIAKSTGIEPQTLPFLTVGTEVEVTGFSRQFEGIDEVMPRMVADLQPLKAGQLAPSP